MDQKKSETKKKTPPKKPVTYLTVDSTSIFGWVMACFIICGCMFFLGVLVGRNTAPVQFDVERIEKKLSNLQVVSVLNQKQGEAATPAEADGPDTPVTVDLTELESNIEDMSKLALANENIIDMLKDKGREPEIYEQYVPPVLTPKYPKTPPAKTEPASADKKPDVSSGSPDSEKTVAVLKPDVPSAPADMPAPVVTPAKTVPVKSAPPRAKKIQPPEASAEPLTHEFAIQVASLKDPEKARQLMNKFRDKGFPAFFQSSDVDGATWHRVRIGPYPDRAMADKDQARLKAAGVDSIIISTD